ncbi:MAG TPA: methyltransferase domain-containing protein [Mycobacteriales bacterium]|nr:methyltransferase domain-containing protein [Mycobacteriales bacterium]
MPPGYRWDPAQYDRYADERGRPFRELVARVRVERPGRIADVGCGPGSLTRSLAERWPDATVVGVDSSVDMIAAAEPLAIPGRLEFVRADLREWRPAAPVDLVVANAVLQWVPGHLELLAGMAEWLAPGGALAFQVPDNFDQPSHTVVRELRNSDRWRERLGGDADRRIAVERPDAYLRALVAAGLEPDVWQAEYLHVLGGEDPVLEWIKGTALRPVLDALAGDQAAIDEFLSECGARLRAVYPPEEFGTVFAFRRTFAVGHRPG